MTDLASRSSNTLGVLIVLAWCCCVDAQLPVVEPSIVWRVAESEIPVNVVRTYRNAFSRDGQLVGILRGITQVQLYNAEDGTLVAERNVLPVNGRYQQEWHDIAFSRAGEIALAGFGGIDVYDQMLGRLITRVDCGACSLLAAIAFSPDDRLLAVQEIVGLPERVAGTGSAYVVDVASAKEVATLAASTGRARVVFAVGGDRLYTMFTEHPSDRPEVMGLKSWRTSDWSAIDSVTSDEWTLGNFAIGRVGDATVAVYGRDENLEMRDLGDGRIVWSVPILPPIFAVTNKRVLGVELDHIAFAPNGEFLITYESPVIADFYLHQAGGIVVRRARDGEIVAIYNVHGVSDLDIAPNSATFVYSASYNNRENTVARVPSIPQTGPRL